MASFGYKDESLKIIQEQFQKFTEEEIKPQAHEWHLKNDLIPDEVLDKMNDMGVSAIGIPEKYDGKSSIKTYLKHFEACRRLNSWTNRESEEWLAARLMGEATRILDQDFRNFDKKSVTKVTLIPDKHGVYISH